MLVGPNDLKQIQLPAAIDGAELQRLALRNGTTYAKLLTDINTALTLAHAGLFSDPLLQSLISITTDPIVEYRMGAQGGFQEHTEYGEPDETRAETSGHMLPIKAFDRALGWSKDYLIEARQTQLDADVGAAIIDYESLVWRETFKRLTSIDAYSGKRWGLGQNGKSVPFADGGACGIVYVPPSRPDRGFEGAETHNHYLRLDGITQANVEVAVTHLWEHGHDGPFDMLVSEADTSAWTNVQTVTGFRPPLRALVAPGANEAIAQVDDTYLGVVVCKHGTVRLKSMPRLEAGFWNVRKSYGPDDPRNPIRLRVDPLHGEAPILDVPVMRSLPVEGAIIVARIGPGVGEDRTSVVNVMNANAGAYRNPVIT